MEIKAKLVVCKILGVFTNKTSRVCLCSDCIDIADYDCDYIWSDNDYGVLFCEKCKKQIT